MTVDEGRSVESTVASGSTRVRSFGREIVTRSQQPLCYVIYTMLPTFNSSASFLRKHVHLINTQWIARAVILAGNLHTLNRVSCGLVRKSVWVGIMLPTCFLRGSWGQSHNCLPRSSVVHP